MSFLAVGTKSEKDLPSFDNSTNTCSCHGQRNRLIKELLCLFSDLFLFISVLLVMVKKCVFFLLLRGWGLGDRCFIFFFKL